MRHLDIMIFTLVTCLASLPAIAADVMQRASVGRDCYDATRQPSSPLADQQALGICNRAVADTSDDYNRAATFINRADIRLRLKDFQGAVDDSEKGIALDPGIAVAYLNRGAGLIGLARYADAIPVLDTAIAMRTARPQLAYFNRGIARESLGDITGAYHDYKMAAEADQTFAQASEQLARFTVKTQ